MEKVFEEFILQLFWIVWIIALRAVFHLLWVMCRSHNLNMVVFPYQQNLVKGCKYLLLS